MCNGDTKSLSVMTSSIHWAKSIYYPDFGLLLQQRGIKDDAKASDRVEQVNQISEMGAFIRGGGVSVV